MDCVPILVCVSASASVSVSVCHCSAPGANQSHSHPGRGGFGRIRPRVKPTSNALPRIRLGSAVGPGGLPWTGS